MAAEVSGPYLRIVFRAASTDGLSLDDLQTSIAQLRRLIFDAALLAGFDVEWVSALERVEGSPRYAAKEIRTWAEVVTNEVRIVRLSYASPLDIYLYISGGAGTAGVVAGVLFDMYKRWQEARKQKADADIKDARRDIQTMQRDVISALVDRHLHRLDAPARVAAEDAMEGLPDPGVLSSLLSELAAVEPRRSLPSDPGPQRPGLGPTPAT